MSIYPQTQGYGVPYQQMPVHSYMHPPAPPASFGYPPQPQFSPHFSDPSGFRREYAARLSELVQNSRPLIQHLSMMAQNNVRFADIVAECLQVHIRRVPPFMKLPAFYVLDAISKNVFDPYAAKFSAFVIPLFIETYNQVDPPIRSKMEEMLVTWRTGAPSGKELFGVAAQVSLERQVWGNDSASMIENPSRRHGHVPVLTKSQVLAELDVTLALKEQASNVNPYDTTSRNQVNVLHQLRRMVEAGVSQEELKQILTQLRAMGRTNTSVPPQSVPQNSYGPPQAAPFHTNPAISAPIPHAPAIPQMPVQYGQQPSVLSGATSIGDYGITSAPFAHMQHGFSSSTPDLSQSTASGVSGINNLFKSLVKAGLVTGGNTPVGAGSASADASISHIESPEELRAKEESRLEEEKLEAKRLYAKNILSMKIRLSTSDITRRRPQNTSSLYEKLPIQCKQCAIRFADGPAGKKRMQDHLDMHFKHNRRAKESVGRGYSRSWFISVDDWINEPVVDVKGKGRDLSSSTGGKNALTASDLAERDIALRASAVVVPPGDEAKSISCPVCKESLKSEFLEEEEEWVWKNAVRVKDKIYHATCHAEMHASATLAAKLRVEGISGSRGATPETTPLQSNRSTPPKLNNLSPRSTARKSPSPERSFTNGLKRKAEDETLEQGTSQSTGTPPLKKMSVQISV